MTTRRRASVVVRIAIAAGLTALGLWPVSAQAASEEAEVRSIAEAWYMKLDLPQVVPGQPELPEVPLPDVCTTLPVPCPTLPALPIPDLGLPVDVPSELPDDLGEVVYPEGTLHVEQNAGRPTARAYIVPDLTLLPDDAKLTGGVMTLPVSKAQGAGNRAVATARFGACLTTTEVTDGARGRLSGAPKFDCTMAASAATYVAKDNAFTIDLEPFIAKWQAGAKNYGVALVPTVVDDAAGAAQAGSTWHVAINGSKVPTGDKASSTFTYDISAEPEETPSETATAAPATGGGGVSSLPVDPGTTGAGIVTPEPPVAPSAPTAPAASEPVAEPLAAAPYALLNNPWYSYRGVVFLPLAFLVALSLTGRSLTRPLNALRRGGA